MAKKETIQLKISSKLKEQSEKVLNLYGLNLNQSITMFLKALAKKKVIPLNLVTHKEKMHCKFAEGIILTGKGSLPSKIDKELFYLYATGLLSYKEALKAVINRYKKV